jgi:hypothetical protein
MSTRQWITLHDTTVRIDEILSIEMGMEKNDPVFMVRFKTLPSMRVSLYTTGGKWLYMICQEGMEEAKSGGERYEGL